MRREETLSNIVYLNYSNSIAETGDYSSCSIKSDAISNITKNSIVIYEQNPEIEIDLTSTTIKTK